MSEQGKICSRLYPVKDWSRFGESIGLADDGVWVFPMDWDETRREAFKRAKEFEEFLMWLKLEVVISRIRSRKKS